MKSIFKASAIILLSIISVDATSKIPCNNVTESEYADKMLDELNGWNSIYNYYYKYSKYGCYSTGYFGESIADSIAKILANKWDTLDELALKSNNNKKFEKFVLSKIDSTVDGNDLIKIHELANKNCPKGLSKTCRNIDKEVTRSFKEMGGKF
ncbi:hypothetical protein [Zymobacter palmae]|uniref:hypothetical protein n=1 Tax=Zymobacter palmae TaxID=33074 RepID=UPI000485EBEE|nr:hypothetical protein [Zymobacter palmae]